LIHLENLSKSFGPELLFEDLSWHIKRGQRVGLIGPNGAGKTTLFGIVTGDLLPDGGQVRRARDLTIGHLPQEIASLAGCSIRDEARKGLAHVVAVGEELRALEAKLADAAPDEAPALMERYARLQARFEMLGGFRIESRVEEVLAGLGFRRDDLDRDCGTLSGGWQMRVALARLLLQSPDVLLLDEPTNHLDLESVNWLESFLQTYAGSLIFISHDRWFLDRLATHIVELAAGELRLFTGNFTDYLRQSELQAAQLERERRNQERRISELERFVERFRYKASKARQVQSRLKLMAKIERVDAARESESIRIRLPEAPRSGSVVMRLADVRYGYGERPIYDGLDLELVRGERIALVGPNGAGKSTLLKLLAGVLAPQRGHRELGHQVRPYYFAQHQVEALDLRRTVLAEALADAEGLPPERVRAVLGAFLFDADDVEKPVGVLSGGEKNRLALAKMLLLPRNVLLLDEPTNHLDMASRAVLEEALSGFGGTLVLISHDRHFIDGVCNAVWDVRDGRVTPYPGHYSDYLARRERGDVPAPLPLHGEAGRRAVAAPVEAEPDKRASRRDDRRREAEARQKRSAVTRPLRAAAEAAEAHAQALEARLQALRATQADPAHYADSVAVQRVAREAAEVQGALDAAYSAWEAAVAALEEAEAGFDGGD
jgi:ATP-binding cassette subfamily F protein 3